MIALIEFFVIVVLLCELLYAHRKHQDALSVLADAFERLADKVER